MKFPVLACTPKGFTELFKSEPETKRMCIGFVGIYKRYQSSVQFFDSNSTVWRLSSIRAARPVPFWQRWFCSLREVEVSMEFADPQSYSVDDFRRALRQAVDADDDILTQYETREDIIQKLETVRTIPEVFRLYRWMVKDFGKVA